LSPIGDINVLKRTNQYVSIEIDRLAFRDLMLFTCPMTLDRYLKTWGTDAQKMVYPYSRFETIEEMKNCTDFPSIEVFNVDKITDKDLYDKCKKMFDTRMNLPATDPERWSSFVDYLKFYNLSDVYPTSLALINQFQLFTDNFGLSPYQCLGLPQFAKKSMYKMYDDETPAVFTFSDGSEATRLFREHTIGGLVSVYKRHVTLDPNEQAPKAAKFNKNGIQSLVPNCYTLNCYILPFFI